METVLRPEHLMANWSLAYLQIERAQRPHMGWQQPVAIQKMM